MRGVAVLGATGSIGQSTLDVMQRHPERYRAVVVSANRSVDDMASICRTHKPAHAIMGEPESALALRERLADLPQVAVSAGSDALDELKAKAATKRIAGPVAEPMTEKKVKFDGGALKEAVLGRRDGDAGVGARRAAAHRAAARRLPRAARGVRSPRDHVLCARRFGVQHARVQARRASCDVSLTFQSPRADEHADNQNMQI